MNHRATDAAGVGKSHGDANPYAVVNLLGLDVHDISRADLIGCVKRLGESDTWSFIVTPNVNHLVRLASDPALVPLYCRAELKICDSKILSQIARHQRKSLRVNTGSDLVSDIMLDVQFAETPITVIGPTRAEFEALCMCFPNRALHFLPAANPLREGTVEWEELLVGIENLPAGIVLVCISFPLQERLCDAISRRGRARGLGVPCGAAIDFLTGKQKRAPKFIREMSLEWLYRMLTQPKRLTKRYLRDAIGLAIILRRGTIRAKF